MRSNDGIQMIDKNNVCDICGYADKENGQMEVVIEATDGIKRCKKCRQLKEYGRVFYFDSDEYEASKVVRHG